MAKPKRPQILEMIINAGSAGCKFEDIQNELKVTRTALFSHVHRLRKKHKINCANSVYTYVSGNDTNQTDGQVRGEQNNQLIDFMTKNPVGADDLCQTFKISKSALFSRIHFLRSKGYTITLYNGLYHVKQVSGNPVNKPQKEKEGCGFEESTNLKDLMGTISMKDLNNLEAPERKDCLDMLRKSMFYRKSAEAIIQANKIIMNITE